MGWLLGTNWNRHSISFQKPEKNSLPFYIRFCNRVDEKFQHNFVIYIGYYITKCVTWLLLLHKNFYNNSDLFYVNILVLSHEQLNTIVKPHVKRLRVSWGIVLVFSNILTT